MQYRLILTLLLGAAGLARSAQAVLVLDKSQAVAAPRTAAGSGLCGSVTHFTAAQPLSSQAEAVAILNQPPPTPADRTSRLFTNINLRNSQQSAGADFTGATYPDELFPYSQDPQAMPPGNDTSFALRLRGYFNVPAALAGRTLSFAIHCDDFCSLRLGSTLVMPAADERVSARVIKQVMFKDAGLYPIEVIYFQNGSAAYLEWARADAEVPECPPDSCQLPLTDPSYAGQFQPVRKGELYSAVAGENSACQECEEPGPGCSPGTYCGNGLCQPCNVPDHCGAGCLKCPADAPTCRGGRCVQCTGECECTGGLLCDVLAGKCISAAPCARSGDCASGMICSSETGRCQNPPVPCTSDRMCPSCQSCDTVQMICRAQIVMCNSDSECQAGYFCDSGDHLCKQRLKNHYVGGLASCSLATRRASAAPGSARELWALGGLLLLGLVARARQRRGARASAGPDSPPRGTDRSGLSRGFPQAF